MDKTIQVQGLGNVPFIDANPKNFFRRTTIAYGPSETGKTIIIYWILNILKNIIPNVQCICPTADANNSWVGRLPSECIKTNVKVKDLYEILERQKNSCRVYNTANDLGVLGRLVRRTSDTMTEDLVIQIKRLAAKQMREIESSNSNYAEKQELTEEIKEKVKAKLIDVHKQCIRKHRAILAKMELDEDEKYSLKYLGFNPSMLLILDDCASHFAEWGKDPILQELFYNGRHWWITTIITMQDDKKLLTGIRKNTFNNFFTDINCAISFFKNTANSFPKSTVKNAEILANYIFKPAPKNFKKMVYSRLDPTNQLRYIVADTYPVFRFGCKPLWDLNDKASSRKKKDTDNKSSKFYTAFKVD